MVDISDFMKVKVFLLVSYCTCSYLRFLNLWHLTGPYGACYKPKEETKPGCQWGSKGHKSASNAIRQRINSACYKLKEETKPECLVLSSF